MNFYNTYIYILYEDRILMDQTTFIIFYFKMKHNHERIKIINKPLLLLPI